MNFQIKIIKKGQPATLSPFFGFLPNSYHDILSLHLNYIVDFNLLHKKKSWVNFSIKGVSC
ncbi:MAG: hypothetical protein CME69_02955 [Halobacteriovorax sp.]|nr:hypothetical protein [Halobacteriovorax sp.]